MKKNPLQKGRVETTEEYLARGGKITYLPWSHYHPYRLVAGGLDFIPEPEMRSPHQIAYEDVLDYIETL